MVKGSWLIISLIGLFAGLPNDAFASQRIPEIHANIIEKLKVADKIKPLSAITKELAEVKINSKISGDLGFIIKSKMPRLIQSEPINVIFEVSSASVDPNKLTSRGAVIRNQHKNLIEVEVPPQNIESIVEEVAEIQQARLPVKFFPLGTTSEGVNLSGATAFHDSDYKGQGVKIALIDVGFKGLAEAQASGDLPNNVITKDYTGKGLKTEYKHGTGCAEIVYDMAPLAQLYLLKVSSEMDIYNALNYCKTENIDIISVSIGTFGSGPGNGTGPIDEACDEARANGILVVVAAGNSGTMVVDGETVGFHWKGAFQDSGFDFLGKDIHQFAPFNSKSIANGVVGFRDFDDDDNPEDSEITIVLRWNNWPNATTDYDMYLIDQNNNVVESSAAIQNGTQPPIEAIVHDIPSSSTEGEGYALLIVKKSGEPSGVDMELFAGGRCMFYPYFKASNSIGEPADAQSVLAVGAINYTKWATGPQESFSSQGPTNAWAGSSARIKPDICGPDMVSTNTYWPGSFPGTSAATPHVAGAAALLLSANPTLTADELQTLLENNAIDMGAPGKDNIYGWGRLNMPEVYEKGDINNDDRVNSADAIQCLRFAVGLNTPTPLQQAAADMNYDGRINSADAIKILRKAVGLE